MATDSNSRRRPPPDRLPPTDSFDARSASHATALTPRRLAIAAAVGLLASFTAVLYHITDVVGGVPWLAVSVGGALLAATLGARLLPVRAAVGLTFVALTLGLGLYLSTIPEVTLTFDTVGRLIDEVVGLLTGRSIFQIAKADLWAVSIAPAPVFVLWYLTLRRRYATAAWAGGLALGFFVLTGDADPTTTLVGTTSGLSLLGFGSLDRSRLSLAQVVDFGLILTLLVLVSRLVSVVPDRASAGSGSGTGGGGGGGGERTMEASLVDAGDQVSVLGSISLSAETRFTVTADRPSYWHVGAYDRYTGRQWVRSGESVPYDGPRPAPPGESTAVGQRFRVESTVRTMPAAWRPVRLDEGPPVSVRVSRSGDLAPTGELSSGDAYAVTSAIPTWTRAGLANAGTDYPSGVSERYLRLPQSTPPRVGRRAAEVSADATTPYEAALAIEQWLKLNKDYSLDVALPSGDVTDGFVFGMESGYCVHFATAMAVMLRTLGVPSRFAVGYTVGEQVAEDRWVVRGFDAHAWVEVYFPGTGWVPFDPTPVEPRRAAERDRLAEARFADEAGIDTPETASNGVPPEPVEIPNSPTNLSALRREGQEAVRGVPTTPDDEPSSNDAVATVTPTPPAEPFHDVTGIGSAADGADPVAARVARGDRVALAAGAVGLLLGGYRYGLLAHVARTLRLHWQRPTDSPEADVGRAFARLERLLERQYRPRRPGETVRAYLAAVGGEAVDERVRRVVDIHERVHYSGAVSRADADEAIETVDELVRESSRLR